MQATRITPRQVVARQAQGHEIAFVDCREESTWKAGGWKVKNAIRVAPRRLSQDAQAIPKAGLVVLYADSEATTERHVQALRNLGFTNELVVLAGGFSAWSQARFPVEPGPTARPRPSATARPEKAAPSARPIPLGSAA